MTKWSDLFTARQLVALTTFSDLVQEAREQVRRDALAAGLPDDGKPLDAGGTGATAYADAVAVYLGVRGRQGCRLRINTLHVGSTTDRSIARQHVSARQAFRWCGTMPRSILSATQSELLDCTRWIVES